MAQDIAALPSLQPVDWAITAIACHAGVEAAPGTQLHEAIGRAYLDRLCKACAVRIDPIRSRIIPPQIIIAGSASAGAQVLPPETDTASALAPTITKVFESWAAFKTREPKLVDEWRTAVRRFAALNGDPTVDRISAKMVRDYRRTCSGLPSRAPKAISSLPLRESRTSGLSLKHLCHSRGKMRDLRRKSR